MFVNGITLGEMKLISLSAYSVCVLMLALLIVVAALLKHNYRKDVIKHFTCTVSIQAAAMIFESVVWMLEGNADYIVLLKVFEALSIMCSYEVFACFSRCLFCLVGHEKVRRPDILVCLVIPHILAVLALLSVFTEWVFSFTADGYYVNGDLLLLTHILTIVVDAYIVLFMIKFRKILGIRSLIILVLFIVISAVLSVVVELDMVPSNVSISVSFVFMYILVIQNMADRSVVQENRLLKMETELNSSRYEAVIAQVKPHFLYNSLATAAGLCLTDPNKAYVTISNFGKYLRSNIESLQLKEPVPFEKELNYVEIYLMLEKERFGDRLNVEYDIRVRNFLIPAITVQPIAENAVKHGLTLLPDGGTVKISAYEDDEYWNVSVKDNGCGFDTGAPVDETIHIGLANVKFRLQKMVNGRMKIISAPGCGTEVIILIPKGQK